MFVETLEFHHTTKGCEQRVVFCAQDVIACMEYSAVLANQNRTCFNYLTAECLEPQTL